MDREPTIRRGRSGPMGQVVAFMILGLAELAIIGVLIVLPILDGAELEMWRIIACAVLLTICSLVFLAVSFVRADGKWQWRWTAR